MQRRNTNLRTESGDPGLAARAWEPEARTGMPDAQILSVGQLGIAPFLRMSAPESLVCRSRCSVSEESKLSSSKRHSAIKTEATLSACGRRERTSSMGLTACCGRSPGATIS